LLINADGSLDLNLLEERLIEAEGKVRVVTVTGASNVLGTVLPIHDIAEIAHRYNALMVVDGAQLVPHRPVDMRSHADPGHIDFLVFSGHKMNCPYMVAIPFSLIGIMPGHWLMGSFFSATSMIGFIAGAGIVVRNSIILVDFIELRLKEGMPLEEAVIDAGAVRFRPMLLTAAAVIVGSAIILTDPIFQGLAISLMAGEIASLILSRSAVPILYYMTHLKSP
jgi:Aminotransferase class-V/AcrB/AcrD/AcrF family